MSEESIGIDGDGNLMPAVRSLIVKHKAGQTGTGGFYSDIHIAVGKNPIRHEDGSGGNRVVEGNVVGFPEPQLRHRLHWFQDVYKRQGKGAADSGDEPAGPALPAG